jgi:hypothetical protein
MSEVKTPMSKLTLKPEQPQNDKWEFV